LTAFPVLWGLSIVAAVGSGLIAGVFFAFSSFVMLALSKLEFPQGLRAMQSINLAVLNPVFLGTFVGTAVISAATAAVALTRLAEPASRWSVAGALAYLLGAFAVTIVFNVPLNNALERASADDPSAEQVWRRFVVVWTRWNHVRTAAAIVAMLALILASRTG